ncbi:S-layer homology domain-containing protein [Paenibacillus sp. BC26]|uniref:S-layer homology domain-containing protein n=1 Tax=Paenibacillus sp. BC26 TaxID=1881032 RepID=UPI0008DEF142|nr:S-layer homology domain-containing protein [Paenibacillus sp. BC26]SFT14680.1 S-layer homology domain-containing protein [Paenibacillus sp. BC26]
MRKSQMRRLSMLVMVLFVLGTYFPVFPGGGAQTAEAAELAEGSLTPFVTIQNNYTGKLLLASEDGKVAYGTPEETDQASHWQLETISSAGDVQTVRIKNRETGTYMSVENWENYGSPVQLSASSADSSVLEWNIMNAVSNGFVNIQSKVNAANYLHMEDKTGYAQSSSIPPEWGSAQWKLTPVTDYVRFKNYYKPNPADPDKYLMAKDGKVGYGNPDPADPASHWAIEQDGEQVRIKNRATGQFMSVEHWTDWASPVELLDAGDNPAYVQWKIIDAVNAGFYVIQSAVDANRYIHVQDNTGYAQGGVIPPDWGTPQWAIETVTVKEPHNPNPDPGESGPAYVRIKNDWLGLYMVEDNGELKYGNALIGDRASHWLVVKEDGVQRLQNRETGHYISLSGITSDKMAVKVVAADESAPSEQLIIDNLNTEGNKLIRSSSAEGQYLHVEKKLGFVQYGSIPAEWGSPKWAFIPVRDQDIPHYIRLQNSYRGSYLAEENGQVMARDAEADNALSHWQLVDAGNGFMRIKNRATGHVMNVEGMQEGAEPHKNPLRSSDVEESWTIAKWTVTEPSSGVYVFRNGYQTDQVIHVEDDLGYAQSSNIPEFWGSAQWVAEDAPASQETVLPDGYVRLKNADTGLYMLENEHGVVLYGTANANDARSHWTFSQLGQAEGHYQLFNRATGHAVVMDAKLPYLQGKPVAVSTAADQWAVETAQGNSNLLLRSVERPLEYAHVQDRMGFVQLGLRSIESPALQWVLETAPEEGHIPDVGSGSDSVWTGRTDAGYFKLVNEASGKAVADLNGVPGTGASDADATNMDWLLQDENGYKLIRNLASGAYLAAQGGELVMQQSLGDDTASAAAMQWRMTERNGITVLESVDEAGMLLRVSGGGVDLAEGQADSPAAGQRFVLVPVKMDVDYEAEQAFVTGGVSASIEAKGYTGKGFIDGFQSVGAAAVFSVFADQAGDYDVVLRYANGSASGQRLTAKVNGLKAESLNFGAGESWDDWKALNLKLKLRRGLNTVTIEYGTGDTGSVFLDRLTLKNAVSPAYRGASVTYDQLEAEHANTNGEILGPDRTYHEAVSEASGRQAVRLRESGDRVTFTLNHPANRVTVRYSIPDSADGVGTESKVGLYINGEKQSDLVFTSKYAWVYGSYPWTNRPEDGDAHRFFDESSFELGDLPAGATLELRKEADSEADYILVDLIETDWADAPYEMPAGFLSVAEFGAVPNDDQDDTEAIRSAIAAAKQQGVQGVWLPEGTFRVDGGPIELSDITIRGAGKWHTVLAGGGFMGKGNHIQVFDLAIDGEVTARRDEEKESGFDGTFGVGSTIQQVRIDHTKAGIWVTRQELADGSSLATDGLYIAGVQIRNTFADGINFSTGTEHAMVEQSQLRNTGDDALAIWANGEQSVGNTFRFNTAELPWLSNTIAVYGGQDIRVSDNLVSDTVAFGAGISVNTRHNPQAFEGETIVERNTLLRTGGREHNWPADFGGLFLFTDSREMTGQIAIRNNLIQDSTYQGISLLGEKATAGIVLEHNVVDGAGTWGIHAAGNISGSAMFGNTIVRGVRVGEFMDGAQGFEFRTKDAGFSFDAKPYEVLLGGVSASDASNRLEAGSTQQAAVLVNQLPVTDGVTWSISDSEIASVNETGLVTAKQAGRTTMIVTKDMIARVFTLEVVDKTAPAWEEGSKLKLTSGSDAAWTVEWTAAQDDSGVSAYRVTWGGKYRIVSADVLQLKLTELASGTAYAVQVDARDSSGNWTGLPLTASFITVSVLPSPPAGGAANTWIVESETAQGVPVFTVDQAELKRRLLELHNGSEAKELVIATGSKEPAAEVVLPAATLQEVAKAAGDAGIVINHAGASYVLPLSKIAALLPADSNAELRIMILQMAPGEAGSPAAGTTGIELRSDIYEFRLSVEVKGSAAVELHDLGGVYFTRVIPVSEDISFDTATGVVYDEAAKQWRHVPTQFTKLADGTVEATIRSVTNSLYAVIDQPVSFKDIQGHWAASAIQALASKRIVSGSDGAIFRPNQAVTRAELTKMIAEALGLPAAATTRFKDISANAWYNGAVGAAVKAGIISGYTDGTFRPKDLISREEMMVMLMRAYRAASHDKDSIAVQSLSFKDADQIAAWSLPSIQEAVALKLVQGHADGSIGPKQQATRAEAAIMLTNLLKALAFRN